MKPKKIEKSGKSRNHFPIYEQIAVPAGIDFEALAQAAHAATGETYKADRIALILNFMVAIYRNPTTEARDGWLGLGYRQLKEFVRNPVPVMRLLEDHKIIESKKTAYTASGTRTDGKTYRAPGQGVKVGQTARYRLLPPYSSDFEYHRLTDRDAIRIYWTRIEARVPLPAPPAELIAAINRMKARTECHSSSSPRDNKNNILTTNIKNIENYYDTRSINPPEKPVLPHSAGSTTNIPSNISAPLNSEDEFQEIFGEKYDDWLNKSEG